MDIETAQQVILAVVTSGIGLYALQYLFPSLQIRSQANRDNAEAEGLSARLVLDISEKYRILAEECSERETELYAVIAEQKETLARLENERDQLVDALRASNQLVDELRAQLKLHERTTQSLPYVDLVANVYMEAEKLGYSEIMAVINDFANRRSIVRDAIQRTEQKD